MIIKTNGVKQIGYFSESELSPSILKGEIIEKYEIDNRVLLGANLLRGSRKLTVSSAGRSYAYNKGLDGASPNSQHLIQNKYGQPTICRAMDLHPSDFSVTDFHNEVVNKVKSLYLCGVRGIGFYTWGVHIDTRRQKELSLWGMNEQTEKQMRESVESSVLVTIYKLFL